MGRMAISVWEESKQVICDLLEGWVFIEESLGRIVGAYLRRLQFNFNVKQFVGRKLLLESRQGGR